MDDLIKALQVFMKYGNPKYPTYCEHNIMMISSEIDPCNVSQDDINLLESLGFIVSEEFGCFISYQYGSC